MEHTFKSMVEECKKDDTFIVRYDNGKHFFIDGTGVREISKKDANDIIKDADITLMEFTLYDTPVSVFYDLFKKYQEHKERKDSMYGERVVVELRYFCSNLKKNHDGNYEGDLVFSYKITGERTGRVYFDEFKHSLTGLKCSINYTERLARSLITLAYSGVYASPYDLDDYCREMATLELIDFKNMYYCETCGEHFDFIGDLIEHLNVTRHKDSIFEEFPYYEPLSNIKRKWGL